MSSQLQSRRWAKQSGGSVNSRPGLTNMFGPFRVTSGRLMRALRVTEIDRGGSGLVEISGSGPTYSLGGRSLKWPSRAASHLPAGTRRSIPRPARNASSGAGPRRL